MAGILLIPVAAIAAIVPMVIYLLLFWWLDRYEREPLWMVGATFAWGAVGGALLAIVFSIVLDTSLGLVLEERLHEAAGPVIVAPFVEELTKGCVLLLILRQRFFDNTTDGFVYGIATGLGFAMTENFLYFSMTAMSNPGGIFGLIVMRTLFSAPLHAMASGTFGAALGLAKWRRSLLPRLAIPVAGVLLAMGLHFAWNGLFTLATMSDSWIAQLGPVVVGLVGLPLVFVVFYGMYELSLFQERRIIGHQLGDEARHGVLPAEYVPVLRSFWRRMFAGWLPPGIPRRHFVAVATKLAFRKHQLSRCRDDQRYEYQEEVRVLRQELQALQSKASPSPPPPSPST